MTSLYLFAAINMGICSAIVFISLCRLNVMNAPVLHRVRSEYAGYIAASVTVMFQPWWGEWPQGGSLMITSALLLGLISTSRAWGEGKPPESATDHAPLGNEPEPTE